MFALVANLDPLAAGADEVFECGVQVECVAHLVKVRHLQVGTLANFAAVRLQLAQDEFEQGGFARAIGAEQTDFFTTHDGAGKVLHDEFVAKRLAHLGQLGHDLAAGLALGHIHVDAAQRIAALGAAGAHVLQPGDAALAAGAARLHTFADPDFFLRQQLVGLGVDDGFLRQLFFLLQHVLLEVAGVGAQTAPVQLHDAGRNPVQEAAVMGDGDDAALEIDQQFFQPFDGVQVQVVGGFI